MRWLNKLSGPGWKKWPSLLGRDRDNLKSKVKVLDRIFGGGSWRPYPVLLTHDIEKLQRFAEDHTKHFGSKYWLTLPTLIAVTPRTFNSTLRALKLFGITPETNKKDVVTLLATKLKTKRRKARVIRQELLGHRQVYLMDQDQKFEDYLALRKTMSEQDRQTEKRELEELARFIRKHPRILSMSIAGIHAWGKSIASRFDECMHYRALMFDLMGTLTKSERRRLLLYTFTITMQDLELKQIAIFLLRRVF